MDASAVRRPGWTRSWPPWLCGDPVARPPARSARLATSQAEGGLIPARTTAVLRLIIPAVRRPGNARTQTVEPRAPGVCAPPTARGSVRHGAQMICPAASGHPIRRVFDIVIGRCRDHRRTNRSWCAGAATNAARLEIPLQTGAHRRCDRPPIWTHEDTNRRPCGCHMSPSTQAPQAARYRGDVMDYPRPGPDQSEPLDERRTQATQPVPGPTVSALTPTSGYTACPGGHPRHVEPSAGPDTGAPPPPRAFGHRPRSRTLGELLNRDSHAEHVIRRRRVGNTGCPAR